MKNNFYKNINLWIYAISSIVFTLYVISITVSTYREFSGFLPLYNLVLFIGTVVYWISSSFLLWKNFTKNSIPELIKHILSALIVISCVLMSYVFFNLAYYGKSIQGLLFLLVIVYFFISSLWFLLLDKTLIVNYD